MLLIAATLGSGRCPSAGWSSATSDWQRQYCWWCRQLLKAEAGLCLAGCKKAPASLKVVAACGCFNISCDCFGNPNDIRIFALSSYHDQHCAAKLSTISEIAKYFWRKMKNILLTAYLQYMVRGRVRQGLVKLGVQNVCFECADYQCISKYLICRYKISTKLFCGLRFSY